MLLCAACLYVLPELDDVVLLFDELVAALLLELLDLLVLLLELVLDVHLVLDLVVQLLDVALV